MVQTNKILTVSYGTFSCTLEGFDESFETMKAIAEYFRDLAADDRYFGAEPPTPDAEMLARIAEREISRRVEAHTGDDGIVLRPSLADPRSAAVANGPLAEPTSEPTSKPASEMVEDAAQDMTDTAAADAVEHMTSDALDGGQDIDAQDIDAQDIKEEVEAEAQVSESPELHSDDARADMGSDAHVDFPEDAPDRMMQGDASDEARELDTSGADFSEFPEDALDQAAAELSDLAASDVEDTPTDQEEETPDSADDETSIAAKLRRIRNVVTAPVTAAAAPAAPGTFDEDDYSEDEHALDMPAGAGETAEDGDVVGNVMATLGSGVAGDALEAEVGSSRDAVDTEVPDPLMSPDRDLAEPDRDQTQSDTDTRPQHPDAEAEAEPVPQEAEAARTKVSPRRPVRVVKVKRRSIDNAVAKGQLIEDEGKDTAGAPAASAPETSLSRDQEADLQRELAELETDLDAAPEALADEMPSAEDTISAEEAQRAVRSLARREQLESFSEDNGDVSRLMAQTDEQLQEPEGRNRRNAIAHLRAAVAATRAERSQGDDTQDSSDPRDAYRDDLAQAVRPRRGAAGAAGADHAETPRVAPLKLVAEQRVDVETEDHAAQAQRAAAQAVRPRRVSLQDDEPEEQTPGGFAAFAEERGASRLPDLLEAAAAYMAFVEGRDKFSRPQLMNKVRQIEDLNTTREDRLRSFGQLLREGKIEKVDGGRFAASDSIGFRPASRAAG